MKGKNRMSEFRFPPVKVARACASTEKHSRHQCLCSGKCRSEPKSELCKCKREQRGRGADSDGDLDGVYHPQPSLLATGERGSLQFSLGSPLIPSGTLPPTPASPLRASRSPEPPPPPDPSWTPPPLDLRIPRDPILPPGMDIKNPFSRPEHELPLAQQGVEAFAVDNPSATIPCGQFQWSNAKSALQSLALPYRRLKFSGCTPGAENFVRIVWTQSLALANVASRVIARFLVLGFPEEFLLYNTNTLQPPSQISVFLNFWENMGRETLSGPPPNPQRQPQFMDPRPRTWLGSPSRKKAARLFSIAHWLHTMLRHGYNQKKSYIIWCSAGCAKGKGACHLTKDRIQLTDRFFDWGRISFSGISPCDGQRLLMHEILHWSEHGLIDQSYWHPDSRDLNDRGPCSVNATDLGKAGRRGCHHGFCATRLASEASSWQAEHNVDNYAYLIRNIGLHWAETVASNPARFPLPFDPFTPCSQTGDCGLVPNWTGQPCPASGLLLC